MKWYAGRNLVSIKLNTDGMLSWLLCIFSLCSMYNSGYKAPSENKVTGLAHQSLVNPVSFSPYLFISKSQPPTLSPWGYPGSNQGWTQVDKPVSTENRASSQGGLLPNVRGLLEFPQLGSEVTLDLSLFSPFLFLPLEWQYLAYASPTTEF